MKKLSSRKSNVVEFPNAAPLLNQRVRTEFSSTATPWEIVTPLCTWPWLGNGRKNIIAQHNAFHKWSFVIIGVMGILENLVKTVDPFPGGGNTNMHTHTTTHMNTQSWHLSLQFRRAQVKNSYLHEFILHPIWFYTLGKWSPSQIGPESTSHALTDWI